MGFVIIHQHQVHMVNHSQVDYSMGSTSNMTLFIEYISDANTAATSIMTYDR
jgi:hypothetical protein